MEFLARPVRHANLRRLCKQFFEFGRSLGPYLARTAGTRLVNQTINIAQVLIT